MKTYGIACDNYKLERFKKELEKNGYPEYTTTQMPKDITLIKVIAPAKDQQKINAICIKVEAHFKRRN